jgi:hypothetical protein
MQSKQSTPWPVWVILVVGIWLAIGHPTPGVPTFDGKVLFKADKLTVLGIEESSAGNTPAWLNSTKPDSVRMKVIAAGGEFLLLDKDDDTSLLPQKWRDAMKVPHTSVPWIVAADKRKSFSAPVITKEDALKRLLPLGVK